MKPGSAQESTEEKDLPKAVKQPPDFLAQYFFEFKIFIGTLLQHL